MRICVAGQGAFGQKHLDALKRIPGVEITSLVGGNQDSTAKVAEKYGIPFVNGESVAANLTERGFKWFFRTTPIATDFAKVYYDFLTDMKAAGAKTDNVAIVHDNTEYGTSVSAPPTGPSPSAPSPGEAVLTRLGWRGPPG